MTDIRIPLPTDTAIVNTQAKMYGGITDAAVSHTGALRLARVTFPNIHHAASFADTLIAEGWSVNLANPVIDFQSPVTVFVILAPPVTLSAEECSHRDDIAHDHEDCLEKHAFNERQAIREESRADFAARLDALSYGRRAREAAGEI